MSLLPHALPRGVPLRALLCALLCGAGVAVGSIGFYYYFTLKRKKAVDPAFPTIYDGEEEGQAEGKPEKLCESVVETVVDDREVNSPQEVLTTQVPENTAEGSLEEIVEVTVTSTKKEENHVREDENQAEAEPEKLFESVVETVVDDGEVNSPQVQTTQVPEDAAEASLDETGETTVTSTIDGESHTLEDENQAESEPEKLCESVVETVVYDGEVNSPQEVQTTQVPLEAAEDYMTSLYRHPPTVWIIGDSYIGCGEESARRFQGTNLGVNAKITWFGKVGLRWRELIPFFSKSLEERGQVPDILVIHCGGNDLAQMSNVQLVSEMKNNLRDLHQCYPQMKIILSEITQRRYWTNADSNSVEPSRTMVNRQLDEIAQALSGCIVHHTDIVRDDPGLYLKDGVNLSVMGNVLFLGKIAACLTSLIQC